MTLRVHYIIYLFAFWLLWVDTVKAEYRYRLYLDGKPGSEYVALSSRAMDRRQRQAICLDSTDLEVSPQYRADILQAGLRIVAQSRWLNTVVVMRPDGKRVDNSQWTSMPYVTKVETLTTSHRATSHRRMEPIGEDEECLPDVIRPVTDDCTSPLRQLNALTSLYDAGYRGQDMLIAVLDAGFVKVDVWDWLSSRVAGSYDLLVDNQADSRVYTADSHGSCCMSIMATPKEHGVCGSAQESMYYLIRTEALESETGFEEDTWVAGAELADSIGADVISSSLGYYEFDAGLPSHSKDEFAQNVAAISRGAKVACQKGMLVCNAAGNEGTSPWGSLLFPADVEEVLTVGGVNSSGTVASFSSRGFTVPYVKPDVLARAQQCYTLNVNSTTGAATSSGAGTSYATPLMAGLCASLWSAVPELTPAQLREAVRQSASAYNAPDSIHGYGIPDFEEALRLAREWTGHHQDEAIAEVSSDVLDHRQFTLTGTPVRADGRYGLRIEGGRVTFRKEN